MRYTKKVIAEQPSFILAVDWSISVKSGFSFESFYCDDIFTAMSYAERLTGDKLATGDVYMVTLYERTSTVQDDGLVYQPRLSSRSRGRWYLHDEEHGEYTGAVLAWYPDAGFACHVAA